MLDLNDLGDGSIPAITPALGNMLAEAGVVCLQSQGHVPGVLLLLRGYSSNSYSLTWSPITVQALRAWNDLEYTTEHGAVAIAVLLAKQTIGYEVIESSLRGTGFDYWLGDVSGGVFQRKARLEVSGIRIGNDSRVRSRVREKLKQTNQSDDLQLPAYVVVVEFGRPLAEVQKK